MREKLEVALTGYPGTGKSTIANHIAANTGLVAIEAREIIKKAASRASVDLQTRKDEEKFFQQQHRKEGLGWLSKSVVPGEQTGWLHVGLRSKYDFHSSRHIGGVVLGVVCPPEIASQRLDPDDPTAPTDLDEYLEVMEAENNGGGYGSRIEWLLRQADHTLFTNKPLEETLAEVDELLPQIIK